MEFHLNYFKSWKMMLWKCCTQYASKFGKLSSGHRTGECHFSFQSLRKAMPLNVQTTGQSYLSHMQAKWCSKFSKPGFNSTWTDNFQLLKVNLEKSEEPEITLPISIGSERKQGSSRYTSISDLDYAKGFSCVVDNKLWKILEKIQITDLFSCLLRNL